MDIGVIAKRYAKALLDFAVEEKCEDTVYQEILTLIQSYKDVPQVATVLGNPLLPQQQKEQVLCSAVSTTEPSPVYKKFAALVVAHRRESFMLFIAHNYITLYRELKHISIGKLITAVPVADAQSNRLEKMIEERSQNSIDVIMETTVDPNILGGFIFQLDDMRLDASVSTQFEQIKKQFIEKNKRII